MKKVNFVLSLPFFIICLTSCNDSELAPAISKEIKLDFKSLKNNPDPNGILTYEVVVDSIDQTNYVGFEFTHTNIKFNDKIVARFVIVSPYQPNNRDFVYASISKDLYVFADKYSSNPVVSSPEGIYSKEVDSNSPSIIYFVESGKLIVSEMKSDSADVFVGNIIWAYAYPKDRMIHIKFDSDYGYATHYPEWRYVTARFNY